MRSLSGPCMWRSWMTVGPVPCANSARHEERKETERVASAPYVTCSQHLPLWNHRRELWLRFVGSMSRVARYGEPGWLIGAVNTSRSFPSPRANNTSLNHPAHLGRSARMTGGAGRIGSHAMPGLVHRTCALPWLAFLHTSPHALEEERASTAQLTARSFPSAYLSRAKKLCAFFFSSPRVL